MVLSPKHMGIYGYVISAKHEGHVGSHASFVSTYDMLQVWTLDLSVYSRVSEPSQKVTENVSELVI